MTGVTISSDFCRSKLFPCFVILSFFPFFSFCGVSRERLVYFFLIVYFLSRFLPYTVSFLFSYSCCRCLVILLSFLYYLPFFSFLTCSLLPFYSFHFFSLLFIRSYSSLSFLLHCFLLIFFGVLLGSSVKLLFFLFIVIFLPRHSFGPLGLGVNADLIGTGMTRHS